MIIPFRPRLPKPDHDFCLCTDCEKATVPCWKDCEEPMVCSGCRRREEENHEHQESNIQTGELNSKNE